MDLNIDKLNAGERELFVAQWDKAQLMVQTVVDNLRATDDAFVKWFKDQKYFKQVLCVMQKILDFFDAKGTLIVVVKDYGLFSDTEEDGDNVQGASRILEENMYEIELPKKFFDEKAFKRQASVLIHEISHLAANMKDLELPPRAGGSSDPIEFDEYGKMKSPKVERPDTYYRYHTEKSVVDGGEAVSTASSYEFCITDYWRLLPKEDKSRLEEKFFMYPKI